MVQRAGSVTPGLLNAVILLPGDMRLCLEICFWLSRLGEGLLVEARDAAGHCALAGKATSNVLGPKWQRDRERKDNGYLIKVKLKQSFSQGVSELKQEATAETEEAATCHLSQKGPEARLSPRSCPQK